MATISQTVGRGDFLLHRGCDERLGVRWKQWMPDTGQAVAVDLSRSSARLEFEDRFGTSVGSFGCTTNDNGLVYADVPASFTGTMPQSGQWRITVVHGGRTVPLGWGQYVTE